MEGREDSGAFQLQSLLLEDLAGRVWPGGGDGEVRERQLSWEGGAEEGEDWSRMEAGTTLSPTVGAFLNDQVLEQHL